MKKIASLAVLGALLLGVALPASAQNSMESSATLSILAQMQTLQSQLASLRAQLAVQVAGEGSVRLPRGIEKRIENGKDFPKGILKKLDKKLDKKSKHNDRKNDWKDERKEDTKEKIKNERLDIVAPELFGVTSIQIGKDSARLIWATSERSDSKAWVSTVTPVSTTGAAYASSTDLGYFHDLRLSGLAASTTYHYIVSTADASHNMTTSSELSFTTSAQ